MIIVVKYLEQINEFVWGDKPVDLTDRVCSWVCTSLLAVGIVDAVIAVGACWYYGDNPFFPNTNKQQIPVTAPLNYNIY